jgi:hypothetical protein
MAGGSEPEGATPMTLGQLATTAADVPAGLLKGGVQGSIGLPGDIISLARGLYDLGASGGSLDAFLAGLGKPTGLPTTEDMKKFFDETVGVPLVPEGADPRRAEAAKTAEFVGELGGAGQMMVQGTGAVAKVVKGISQEMATTPPVGAIRIPQLILDLKAQPKEVSRFAPQAERSPAVVLTLMRPEIIGTGKNKQIIVSDVGKVVEQAQMFNIRGKRLDPSKPRDLARMVDAGSAEAEFQLAQPISGKNWYEDEVSDAFTLGSKIVPELATSETMRVLTTAFAASTSYSKRAADNWVVALKVSDGFIRTGDVPSRNPENGALWGPITGRIMEQQLKLHQYMINRMGPDDYARWLLTLHPVSEINQMKLDSGLYKGGSVPGKATDMKFGAFIMGEKGGPFMLNLNGIKETTADKWFTRTYNRHTGTLTFGPVGEQGVVDAPRNEAERSVMKVWNRSIAQNVGLDEQANQAVLWFYEQNLYQNLGVKSARSESFSDGAKRLLNTRGIPFTDAELAAGRRGSDATEAAAQPTGSPRAGNAKPGRNNPAQQTASPVTRGTAPRTKGGK